MSREAIRHGKEDETCIRGHEGNWYQTTKGHYACRTCKNEAVKRWRQANPDRAKEIRRKHEEANRDEILDRQRKRYYDNIEENRARDLKRNKTEKRRRQMKAGRLKAFHGIDYDDYMKMIKDQEFKCQICKCTLDLKDGRSRTGAHVDHDHRCCSERTSCNKCFRGIICASCNNGLGNFYDSIDTLYQAIEYLERYESKRISSGNQTDA